MVQLTENGERRTLKQQNNVTDKEWKKEKMKFLKRTIGIIIVMAAIISGLQLKSELAYGATPTISKSTVTLEKGKRKK